MTDLKKICITVSGLHGTGKTTIAENFSKHLNLRHISAGRLFRQIALERGISVEDLNALAEKKYDIDRVIDERTKLEARKGDVIIDGLLVGWIAGELADVKIYLRSDEELRLSRIAKRDNVSYNEAKKRTLFREKVECTRFKKFYEIDITDIKIYDLVLNTGLFTVESNISIIGKFIREYIKLHGEILHI